VHRQARATHALRALLLDRALLAHKLDRALFYTAVDGTKGRGANAILISGFLSNVLDAGNVPTALLKKKREPACHAAKRARA
jgi:hypothetical protein